MIFIVLSFKAIQCWNVEKNFFLLHKHVLALKFKGFYQGAELFRGTV